MNQLIDVIILFTAKAAAIYCLENQLQEYEPLTVGGKF